VQIARGAHFVSHVLWSAWIVWGVNVALLGFACAVRERQAQAYSRTPHEVREIS
jgi:membrane-associated PAP2 superfamily phosphatase